jgi:uncharacterized phiE125 gp8 family phage protein
MVNGYKVVTPVATEPVTLAAAKLHLRVDATTENTLITSLITAAREQAEHYAGRAFAAQTLEAALDDFPGCDGEIVLPMGPVASVSSLKYTDTAGVEQTFSASSYALSAYGASNRITLAADATWPSTDSIADAVRIRYVTGSAACPKAAISAILLIVSQLYEGRTEAGEIPVAAKALLNTLKVYGA